MALTYFADLPNGETLRFRDGKDRVWNKNQSSKHNDTWGWTGAEWVKIARVVNYKSNPSLHECDARCMNASGRTMNCECSCGGKNHGKGRFNCEEAA